MDLVMSLNICVGRCPEQAMMPRLAAAGFDGLDFNFCDMNDRIDWFDDRAVGKLIEPWQAAAEAVKLRWLQGHGPMFSMFSSEANDQKCKALSAPSITAAGRLGVPWMVFHPDVFAGPFDKAHRRALLMKNADFFRSLLPVCESANVGIAIENIFDAAGRHGNRQCARFYGAVPEELCELIDELNHPLIGACWDTGHARLMHHDQAACLESIGPRLKAVHIQDNDGRNDDHMLPFVNGADGVDWAAVARGLGAACYAGPFTYEVHNAFRAVPEQLLDLTLYNAVKIGRHLTSQITTAVK